MKIWIRKKHDEGRRKEFKQHMIDYKSNPFYLSDEDIIWIEETYGSMTTEEKIGQLFVPIVFSKDETELRKLVQERYIGGMLYRDGAGAEIQEAHNVLQKYSKVPLLTASNLEHGGVGSAIEGTYYGNEMLAAATKDAESAYRLGKISCSEGKAVGVNWAFAPVVDIDINFRNPITNVRTFGSDMQRIIEMGKHYIKAAKEEGVATAVKHFPGDGVDERDQHLLTSVNSLSCEDWDNTYGKIYQEMIEAGTLTIMCGHISMPAYEEFFDGEKCRQMIPATLSKNLLLKLLREKLGFNGLIVTDASPMVGFCSAMERETAVPMAIACGCDMFLFNKNMEEDFIFMRKGYEKGILTEKRLEEAVKRILAVKAALKLHQNQETGTIIQEKEKLSVLNCEKYDVWARECADKGVTLVKNLQEVLPLSPKKQKHILMEILGDFPSNERVAASFKDKLEKADFKVSIYKPEGYEAMYDTVENFKRSYDLVLYVANIETVSNKTVSRLHWHTMFGLGNNIPWFINEVPAIFVSVGNPYHLLDAPMIKTYINGYCNSEYVIHAVVEKLLGISEFQGVSPVDAFCGREDTKY